ncbi:DUF6522 family protein [Aurantimonas sp. A2-1-M11]|uniref:DUF6522 family protein n=1 Tax=Aurantimonas sp. A2-1-M11 TaxID=3113712 RepID=UPI002F92971B
MADHPAQDHAEDVEVDSAAIAAALGLPVAFFRAELRRGHVRGTVERGIGADAGRHRLVFRYRGRMLVMIRHPDGSLAQEEASDAEPGPPCRP